MAKNPRSSPSKFTFHKYALRPSVSRSVLTTKFDVRGEGWRQDFLLLSDLHIDSPGCDRDLLLEILGQAKDRGALILLLGDTFDLMQGKFDPRRSYDQLRPEYKGGDYLGLVTKDASRILAPFADNLLLIASGNHEMSVRDNCNVDPLTMLKIHLDADRSAELPPLTLNGIGGWARMQFEIGGTQREALNIYYHHGAGGAAPVTQGTIQTNRQAVYTPDAHIVVNGHTHTRFLVEMIRQRLTRAGAVGQDSQWHLRCSTFNDDFGDGSDGFHNKTWKGPKPKGGWWVTIEYRRKHMRLQPPTPTAGMDGLVELDDPL